nr:MAG TPA: hypothetical protein [Caudoviricetes sp.]
MRYFNSAPNSPQKFFKVILIYLKLKTIKAVTKITACQL